MLTGFSTIFSSSTAEIVGFASTLLEVKQGISSVKEERVKLLTSDGYYILLPRRVAIRSPPLADALENGGEVKVPFNSHQLLHVLYLMTDSSYHFSMSIGLLWYEECRVPINWGVVNFLMVKDVIKRIALPAYNDFPHMKRMYMKITKVRGSLSSEWYLPQQHYCPPSRCWSEELVRLVTADLYEKVTGEYNWDIVMDGCDDRHLPLYKMLSGKSLPTIEELKLLNLALYTYINELGLLRYHDRHAEHCRRVSECVMRTVHRAVLTLPPEQSCIYLQWAHGNSITDDSVIPWSANYVDCLSTCKLYPCWRVRAGREWKRCRRWILMMSDLYYQGEGKDDVPLWKNSSYTRGEWKEMRMLD